MGCGELVLALNRKVRALEPGTVLEVVARDRGGREDIPAFCRLRGYTLVAWQPGETEDRYWIRREPDSR
ncbi:MAG: sulfurtransferase TusA family protein [Firmicutes bacterium]|nr:sulfurtransferase TusA family protein [Alicyclobacillaceae bacterium]MCL6497371.1 sulfurtransferase TusA family protein [Bacillota bacterium]